MRIELAALIGVTSSLGYLLPAIIGLESMGIPSPGETALILAAVLASQGKLQIELVLLIGIASAIIGDNIGYLLGRHFGRDVLTAAGPFQHRRRMLIAVGDRFFDKHGSKAVFLGRWVALVRIAAAWLAGINHMRFRTFFFWNALGGITWGLAFGLAGYFGGHAAAHIIEEFGIIAAIVFAVGIVVAVIVIRTRERRAHAHAEAELAEAEAGAEAPAGAEAQAGAEAEAGAEVDATPTSGPGQPPDPARTS
jgi:membrane protein DedA with SNARE-associated domain